MVLTDISKFLYTAEQLQNSEYQLTKQMTCKQKRVSIRLLWSTCLLLPNSHLVHIRNRACITFLVGMLEDINEWKVLKSTPLEPEKLVRFRRFTSPLSLEEEFIVFYFYKNGGLGKVVIVYL